MSELNRSELLTGPGPCAAVRKDNRLRQLLRLDAAEVWILAGFFIYAALFIYRTSFTIGGVRYFCLFDDDMISMRYAANLAHHHGLVWNPGGERVLGFTNLLWVLYMSLFHLLPIPPAKIALSIQISGAAFLAASLLFVNRVARKIFPEMRSAGAVAMCLTAFYGPLVNWSLQGTEVSLLTLAVAASVWLAMRALDSDAPPYGLYALLGLSTLCRVDMAVVAGAVLLSLALLQPRRWIRHLIVGGSIVFSFLLAQFAFNFFYYGDALPNTYYLKMTGYPLLGRLRHGAWVAALFVLPFLPLLNLMRRAPRTNASAGRSILVTTLAAQLAYSIWVGGDAWEWWGGANRYVAVVMPLFFVLLAGVFVSLSRVGQHSAGAEPERSGRISRMALAALIVQALLLGDVYRLPAYLLLEKPLETAGNADMVRQAMLIRSLTDEDATVAVVWAGALPYFAGRRAIDLLGKSDAKIAREPMHVESTVAKTSGFWPGHLKWDYGYTIGQLKPDVIAQMWGERPPDLPWLRTEYQPIMAGGHEWYVKRGSPHFRWNAPVERGPIRAPEDIRSIAIVVYTLGLLLLILTIVVFQRAIPSDEAAVGPAFQPR